ncbi:patatin-like phospholipase family protein [Bacteroides sp. 519]|uniref:patatin-like phospholipase family protein n=1 Tax=Bacteroides sp. 519 TaxID=2302937 RepID=UPI0013D7BD59|nr:patatin-like phospholipase family protein [Bacteroides sp. 519]NDV58439.1 phospholipase [Bacteroides sp. 519]
MIQDKNPLYKLGLALSGGGARGFAHLGVLKAMEERNLRPDIISGTSVGSLIAVFYADGYTTQEIMKIGLSVKFTSIIEGIIPRGGFFKTTGVQHLLVKYIRAKRFEDLNIPVRVVASDIESGKAKVFSKGEIIPAVLASCSVPIVFTPVNIDDHHYVDGGLLMNFPVSVIRRDCKTVLGVNISPVISMKYEESMKYVIERCMNYMVGANTSAQRDLCDYLIECNEVSEYSIFDFKHNQEIYKKGYTLACTYLDDNKKKIDKDLLSVKSKGLGRKIMKLLGKI